MPMNSTESIAVGFDRKRTRKTGIWVSDCHVTGAPGTSANHGHRMSVTRTAGAVHVTATCIVFCFLIGRLLAHVIYHEIIALPLSIIALAKSLVVFPSPDC